MLRMYSLYCPFTSKVHPDASAVHERSVLWARSLGMLPTEQHIQTAHHAKVGWLIARAFPTATPDGLQLIADWTMLFCALDDHIERRKTAAEVEAHLQHLLHVFQGDTTRCSEDPFATGMLNLRQRILAMASSSHLMNCAGRLAELFAGNVTEARERERAQIPDVASYLQLREVTIGLQVMLALADLFEGSDVPFCIRGHLALQKLATHASHIVGLANDLFTYEKEILQGEMHNVVLVLMNERRLTIAEAVAQAVALHDEEVRSFLRATAQLPCFGAADPGVQRHVEMLRCWIRGHLDWARETGRYRPFHEPAGGQARRLASRSAAA
jgi:avermitilol synthase